MINDDNFNIDAVECLIQKQLGSNLPLQHDMHAHWLNKKGKAIRAQLVLASARGLGPANQEALQLGAIIELLHAATLLHDDVIDHATERRNQPSCHQRFGNHASILCGDYLYAMAFEMIAQLKHHDMNRVLAKATATIVRGEIHQAQAQKQWHPSIKETLAIMRAKTARLFATACELGAMTPGKPDAIRQAHLFGHAFGMAYQLIDDALDYVSSTLLGKAMGNDFAEGKRTMPFLLAWHALPNTQRHQLEQAIEAKDTALIPWVSAHGVRPCIELAQAYARKAEQSIAQYPSLGAALRPNLTQLFERIEQTLKAFKESA